MSAPRILTIGVLPTVMLLLFAGGAAAEPPAASPLIDQRELLLRAPEDRWRGWRDGLLTFMAEHRDLTAEQGYAIQDLASFDDPADFSPDLEPVTKDLFARRLAGLGRVLPYSDYLEMLRSFDDEIGVWLVRNGLASNKEAEVENCNCTLGKRSCSQGFKCSNVECVHESGTTHNGRCVNPTGCTVQTLYSNGFETGSGLSDWTQGTFIAGGSTASWRGIQTCTAQTGSSIFRYGGTTCTANYGNDNFNFAQPNGAGGITVPAGSIDTLLSFSHRRRFESGYDGGTLVISVDGVNYSFIPASAIFSGSTYNGTIAPDCAPAGAEGASVFTGSSDSFTNTTVDLDAACNAVTGDMGGCAGHAVRIGFTSITDCSGTGDGWFLDDVVVSTCVPP